MNRADLIRQRLKEGATNAAIGAELGISRERVRQLINEYDLHRAGDARWALRSKRAYDRNLQKIEARWDPELRAIVSELRKNGLTVTPMTLNSFTANGRTFVYRVARTAKPTSARSKVSYYRFQMVPTAVYDYYLFHAIGLGLYILPHSEVEKAGQTLYFAHHGLGRWMEFKDAWPFRKQKKAA